MMNDIFIIFAKNVILRNYYLCNLLFIPANKLFLCLFTRYLCNITCSRLILNMVIIRKSNGNANKPALTKH